MDRTDGGKVAHCSSRGVAEGLAGARGRWVLLDRRMEEVSGIGVDCGKGEARDVAGYVVVEGSLMAKKWVSGVVVGNWKHERSWRSWGF